MFLMQLSLSCSLGLYLLFALFCFDHFPDLSTDVVSILNLFSHSSCFSLISISSFFFTRKIHRVQYVFRHYKKNNPWLEHIIDREKGQKKKKRFPQLLWRGCPFNCSVCLSASWLCSASTHSGTSINASCYAATLYTTPYVAWVTLPGPVNISCVHHHRVIRVGFTDG